MKSIIRKLDVTEIPKFVEIALNAYPAVVQNTPEFKERMINNMTQLQGNEDAIEFYGLFREGKIVGGMRLHYFKMNLYSQIVDVGGVGQVAVDLLHKKEHVAKELIEYFIDHFKEKRTSLLSLYPFRPDFYKKMGFGHGTKMNKYHIKPSSFPKGNNKDGLMFLDQSHKTFIKDCYNRYAKETHGMMFKTDRDIELMFRNPDHKLVGYMNGDRLESYMLFSFKKMSESNFIYHNLVVHEMIYENPEALSKLTYFLHTQDDQINRVTLTTQDDAIEYLISDPRNDSNHLIPSVYHETNTSGTGLMYRIIDMDTFIDHLSNYSFHSETCTVGFYIVDDFMPQESKKVILDFKNGTIFKSDSTVSEVEVELKIAEFSSLMLGAVTPRTLYDFGKLTINDLKYLTVLQRIFVHLPKPLCVTAF